MFSGLSFYLEKDDVDEKVRTLIEENSGVVLTSPSSSSSSDFFYVVNQNFAQFYGDKRKFVFQNWINKCVSASKRVSYEPFLVNTEKRIKGALYTEEEDNKLFIWASTHKEEKLTQDELWQLAEEDGLLDGRTQISMLKRYREIKNTRIVNSSKTNKHFKSYEDEAILRWAFLWRTKSHPTLEADIWQAAQKKFLVHGKTASQMKARYHRLIRDNGGDAEKVLKEKAKEPLLSERDWDFFV